MGVVSLLRPGRVRIAACMAGSRSLRGVPAPACQATRGGGVFVLVAQRSIADLRGRRALTHRCSAAAGARPAPTRPRCGRWRRGPYGWLPGWPAGFAGTAPWPKQPPCRPARGARLGGRGLFVASGKFDVSGPPRWSLFFDPGMMGPHARPSSLAQSRRIAADLRVEPGA